MVVIEKGTIKVVWASSDGKHIYSKMFEDLKKAEMFGKKKKEYLIFKLLHHKNMNEFAWVLLPYGKYKIYQRFVSLYYQGNIQKLLALAEQF